MYTLWITDHAFQRFTDLHPHYKQGFPIHHSHLLTQGGLPAFRKTLKAFFKSFANTTRVTLPAKKQWGKFLKHGVQDELLLCAKDWTTFVIVREGSAHTVVTVTRPPKEKRDAEVDDSVSNPAGALYFKQVTGVVVPYSLLNGVRDPNNGIVNAMHNFQVQVYFGRADHASKTAAPKFQKES